MGKNWFVEDANDFGYVVSDVVKLMVSNKSCCESTKASAQNTKASLQEMITNVSAALNNETITNITPEEKADLISKVGVVNTMISACDGMIAAVDTFIAGMEA